MLRSTKRLLGYDIQAEDGEIGEVDDFYFDDQEWAVRYMVVDTGPWILGRKVLIAVKELGEPDWESEQFPISLTKEQVKGSPDIDISKPVSRQHEIALHNYSDWQPYWFGPAGTTAPGMIPPVPSPGVSDPRYHRPVGKVETEQEQPGQQADPHLRSADEVFGYAVRARDDQAGYLHDFIIDDQNWKIRYIVVDVGSWLPGRKVIFAASWVESIIYPDSSIRVDLSRETIEKSPEYDPDQPVIRQYEQGLYDHYGRPYDWEE